MLQTYHKRLNRFYRLVRRQNIHRRKSIRQSNAFKVGLFGDPSGVGVRLREWLLVIEVTFYDASKFAILPMGFCYANAGLKSMLASHDGFALGRLVITLDD